MIIEHLSSFLLSLLSYSIVLLGLYGVAMIFMLNLISRYFEKEIHGRETMRIVYLMAYRFRMIESMSMLLYVVAFISGTLYVLSTGIGGAASENWMAFLSIVLLYIIFLVILYFYTAFLETFRSMLKLLGES